MAYVPPHKRHTKEGESSTPVVPELLTSEFKEKFKFGATRRNKDKRSLPGGKILYARHSISKWWPIGSMVDDPIPTSFCLEPFSCQCADRPAMEKALVLVNGQISLGTGEVAESTEMEPWVSITEKILPDLLSTLRNLGDEIQSGTEEFKPSFVARLGKILFHGESSLMMDSIRKAASFKADSRSQVHKSFRTNVPRAYMEDVENVVVPKMGIKFDSEKEHYHVRVSDNSQPDCTISCKCVVREYGRKLVAYKFELNQVRHLVVDISCLYKDLDLRLMLCNKRILTDLNDEEKDCLNKLINAAIVDKDVKGGLRWALGKESVGDRFSVVGVWHSKYRAFKGPTMRLKLREANRFNFKTSSGEVSSEVSLKMTGVNRQLHTGAVEPGPTHDMLQESIELIWDHFLDCKHAFT